MRKRMLIAAVIGFLVAIFAIAACGDDGESKTSNRGLPQGSEPSKLDPADFSTNIDNPYWPMSPGSKWVYSENDSEGTKEKAVVTVTDKTKLIANGITARVIHDVVTEKGTPVEVTDDWYAQDKDGNVWYLGEAVRNFKNGKLADREGSFEAGVDGAQPGIAMPADPEPGLSYRQEYYKGKAEDKGAVITVGEEQVEVPAGYFTGVLMTRDLVPLEPKVQELKFYARDVGPVLSLHTDGPGGRAALVRYTRGKQFDVPGRDYGSREYSARDLEGNVWSFGTYQPTAAQSGVRMDEVIFLPPGAGRSYDAGPMHSVFKADGVETGDRYCVSEWWLDAGQPGPGPHSHEANEELFYVVEGTMSFLAGAEWIDASRGSFLRIPAGTMHDFENRSDARAGVLNVFIPGGFETMMPRIVEYMDRHPVR